MTTNINPEPKLEGALLRPAIIKRACAWCDKEQGVLPDRNTSHGICAEHKRKVLAAAGIGVTIKFENR